MNSRPVYVYALCEDHDLLTTRYVGKTYDMKGRYKDHLATREFNKRTHKAHWIKKLLSEGRKPIMVELECVEAEGDWANAERKWIAYFKNIGVRLTNATEGGEGCPGRILSDESRRKIGEASAKRTHTAETKAQIRQSMLGKQNSLGHKHSPETRAKKSEAHRLYWQRRRLDKLASNA